ncbi:aspartate kinase [Tremella mesenterica]|uniref:aspartate kinase n=1 Tax=Tremella mesenterica TaxID=5217 RepID=A0A4Q1BEM8_TREME|nr:aspartate kinase [Tremella mesenterica]
MVSSSASSSTPTSSTPDDLLRNSSDERVPWVVQKSNIPDYRVALVCSARSSHTKALGTTNLLLQASKEALLPPNPAPSGTQTPFFPKRVGSGFFGDRDRERESSVTRDMSASLMSSISSLRELDLRSSSPSPFTPSGGRSGSPPISPRSLRAGGDVPAFEETVDVLKKGHLDAARLAVRPGAMRDELEDEIERDCESLRSFLYAAQIIDEISPRSQDSIIGTGERLACKIVAAALRNKGVDCEFVCLDSIVDATVTFVTESGLATSGDQGAAQLSQEFYDQLAKRLGERIRACGTRVPVITGYFGPVPGSLLAQIGRGYTDLCAALCAVGVKASELQVWKEVDGIFTADPRKVPSARLVPVITPDEAAELTYYGSEVIHPFTMEQVIRARIPIRIKNVENPSGAGTIIYPDEGLVAPIAGGIVTEASKVPTAVTIKDHIIVINIHSNRKTLSHGFLARIFGTLDRAGVVVDLISTSEVHVSMAMQEFHNKKRLDRLVKDLEKIGDVTISREMAILSLVGRNMRHAVGCAGMMFTALAGAGINIEMISQGASEINISCVILGRDSSKALNVIHETCINGVASPRPSQVILQ